MDIVNNKEPVLKLYQSIKPINLLEISLYFCKWQLHFPTAANISYPANFHFFRVKNIIGVVLLILLLILSIFHTVF